MKITLSARDLDENIELTKHHTFTITRQVGAGAGLEEEIRVRINQDGTLNINANHQLKILPTASNSVFIDFSK